MVDVTMNTKVPAAVQQVWKTVGEFGALSEWHPAVASSQSEEGGKRRRLKLVDGSELLEELVEHDDNSHSYTYTMVQAGPLPVQNYRSTIHVTDAGNGESKVTWSGSFDPAGEDAQAARQTLERVYETGLDNLKKMFGQS